ncbi:hypothetical protein H0H81_009038, partial [Sphagnurus paluster]
EKKKNKNDGGKLDKNLPFLLTSDAFLEHVWQKEKNTEATHKAREQKKDRKLDYDKEMVEWEKAEEERKLWNGEWDKELKTAKEVWQREKKNVKAKGGKIKDWKETHPEPKQSRAGHYSVGYGTALWYIQCSGMIPALQIRRCVCRHYAMYGIDT